MGGDDPAPPTPTFEPVRRPSPAYGLPRGNLVAQARGKGAGVGERADAYGALRLCAAGTPESPTWHAVGLGLALGALQQYVPFPKVYEVCL